MPDHDHAFGDSVSVHEVLWRYLQYDFALDDERHSLNVPHPDPARYDELVAALIRKKPWPKDAQELHWRYEQVPRSMLASVITQWGGPPRPLVPEVVQRMERMAIDEWGRLAEQLRISEGSLHTIARLAADAACGSGPGYQSVILVRKDGVIKLYEGSHRLCAVWMRFRERPKEWPATLGAFVGEP